MSTATQQQPRQAPSEGPLLDRLRKGDRKAFDELVRDHRAALYMTARRLLGTHEDADEATQVAFVRAWRALQRFRGESSLRTWLTRIVLNVSKTMRAARREGESADDQERLEDRSEPSDRSLERRQLRGRVRRAVSRLPPRQQEVVVLKVFSEMTYREVAQVMSLSEGTVKAHLHQAVSNLRRLMGETAEKGSS